VSLAVNRKLLAGNMTVQLLASTPTLNVTMHSIADGRTVYFGVTDDTMMPITDHIAV